MVWILWDAIFLLSGSLFTFGTGPSNSPITEANISFDTQTTEAPNTPSSDSLTNSVEDSFTTNIPAYESSVGSSEAAPTNTMIIDAAVSVYATSAEEPHNSTNSNRSSSTETPAATTNNRPVQKFVVAAVRSHFDDCPDSHQHFCFHGTCRFLILEETPACVCHPGFVGLRCEHADLLAVVATNHRQQAVATVLVLCVISCVLIMVLCSFLHCWWRQDCRRRRRAHLYATEKHGASCYPPESVV